MQGPECILGHELCPRILVVRGQLDISEDVQTSRLWRDFGHKGILVMKVWEGCPRRNALLAKHSRGQKV